MSVRRLAPKELQPLSFTFSEQNLAWVKNEIKAGKPAEAAAAAAGPNGKVFAMSSYGDWLLWSRPGLRGRVAFDARFELLNSAQVKRLGEFQARIGDWMTAVRGYRVIVLDRVREPRSSIRARFAPFGSTATWSCCGVSTEY